MFLFQIFKKNQKNLHIFFYNNVHQRGGIEIDAQITIYKKVALKFIICYKQTSKSNFMIFLALVMPMAHKQHICYNTTTTTIYTFASHEVLNRNITYRPRHQKDLNQSIKTHQPGSHMVPLPPTNRYREPRKPRTAKAENRSSLLCK